MTSRDSRHYVLWGMTAGLCVAVLATGVAWINQNIEHDLLFRFVAFVFGVPYLFLNRLNSPDLLTQAGCFTYWILVGASAGYLVQKRKMGYRFGFFCIMILLVIGHATAMQIVIKEWSEFAEGLQYLVETLVKSFYNPPPITPS